MNYSYHLCTVIQRKFSLKDPGKKIKEGFVGQKMIVLPPNVKKVISKNLLSKNLYLTNIGFYPNAVGHHRERKQGSQQYILIYCTEGTGEINLRQLNFKLSPNTYFIIPRTVPHHYKSSERHPWSIYWIHFSGDYAEELYKRNLINNQLAVHNVPFDEERIKLFDSIYKLLEHSFDIREMEIINFKLLDFITSLIYHKEIDPSFYTSDAASSSIAYMRQNIAETFTIQHFAEQQNMSVSHYSRIFKQKTGLSPMYYFNQLKVQKSCQYLYFTNRSIKEISNEAGFQDPYYFSRLFKKFMGVSPAKYKGVYKK